MIAALLTAAAAVVAAAPLSTSRRFTSIVFPPNTPVPHHAEQAEPVGYAKTNIAIPYRTDAASGYQSDHPPSRIQNTKMKPEPIIVTKNRSPRVVGNRRIPVRGVSGRKNGQQSQNDEHGR